MGLNQKKNKQARAELPGLIVSTSSVAGKDAKTKRRGGED